MNYTTLYVTEGSAGIEVNHKTICHIVYPGVAVTQHKLQAIPTSVQVYSSLVPRRSEGRGERTPGTHCLRMRSEISRKIGYFSNPRNDDV